MHKKILIISVLILIVLSVGYIIGINNNDSSDQNSQEPSDVTSDIQINDSSSEVEVKSLVNYSLPSGWSESTCPSSNGSIYFRANGAPEIDCSNNPSLSISLSAIGQNITECSQIQDVQEVKKHICKSVYINELRSLVAETEFLSSSIYGRDTLVKTYYIDFGSGIVKAQFVSAGNNQYQNSFDELVNSISAK